MRQHTHPFSWIVKDNWSHRLCINIHISDYVCCMIHLGVNNIIQTFIRVQITTGNPLELGSYAGILDAVYFINLLDWMWFWYFVHVKELSFIIDVLWCMVKNTYPVLGCVKEAPTLSLQ
jgi:hypothetical protein